MTVAIGLITAASLAMVILPRSQRARTWELVRGIRLRHVLGNVPAIAVVITTTVLLYQVPALQWSWWQQLSGRAENINFVGLDIVWLLPATALLLLAAIPLLAESEETLFREGTRTWRGGTIRSIVFGLVHVLAGIPVAAALALCLAGMWFTWHYFRGGLDESTRWHATWNYLLVVPAIVIATFQAVAS